MDRNIYISTIAPDASEVAREYGFGLEIAEYCTAWNMDDKFAETDAEVRSKIADVQKRLLHAPFNELFPCAIDPKARELARERYMQAIKLAKLYGADKVIIHGGYNERIYYPVWYVEQSVVFWKQFVEEVSGVEIVLENVLETEPEMILDIVKGVNNPRFKLCLDVGHVNAYSKVSVMDWLTKCAPYIGHFHIHNNDGSWDTHNALFDGTIPMQELLTTAFDMYPNATFTMEVLSARESAEWIGNYIKR